MHRGYSSLGSDAAKPGSKFRILQRDPEYYSTVGAYNIKRVGGSWRRTYLSDWFHTMVNQATWKIVVSIIAVYYLALCVFATGYYFAEERCQLHIHNYKEAFYFSLETMMTIGYGTRDQYFGNCNSALFLISAQAICAVLVNSICVGIMFARLSRGQQRARSIIFSEKGIIRRIRGQLYFMFQVAEIRKHQLLEARVRLYAIKRLIDAQGRIQYYQTYFMRLQHPDDQLGAPVLLALPARIVHRLDAWSPLVPGSHELDAVLGPYRGSPGEGAPVDPRDVRLSSVKSMSTDSLSSSDLCRSCSWTSRSDSSSMNVNATSGSLELSDQSAIHGPRSNIPPAAWCNYQRPPANPYLNAVSSLPPVMPHYPGVINLFPDVAQREIDAENGGRNSAVCEVCGDSFITLAALARHQRFNAATHGPYLAKLRGEQKQGDENKEQQPAQASPSPSSPSAPSPAAASPVHQEDSELYRRQAALKRQMDALAEMPNDVIKNYMTRCQIEIVALVEGNDASTSSVVQARHSYTLEDIIFDHTFAACVFPRQGPAGGAVVDFSRFHDLVPVASDVYDAELQSGLGTKRFD